MDNVKLGLMSAILEYLRGEFRAGYLDSENAEGLEVAIHCLENIYDVNNVNRTGSIPPLMDIYKSYYLSSVLSRRDATEEEKAEGERLKVEGNIAMSNGKFMEAFELYSRAIDCNPKNAVYYCNRAAAHSKLNDHNSAVNDCKIAIELDPKYSKAYGRLGLAYCGLESYVSALENYKKAHDLEPENEGYRRNFELAQEKVAKLCHCSVHDHSPSTSSGQNPTFNAPRNPNSMDLGNEAANNHVLMDINTFFGNPQLVNIASQMLSDPAMQNMMSSIMNQESGNGMQALLQAGHNLARQMQNENPGIIHQLRQTFVDSANFPGEDLFRLPPDSDEDGGGDASHEKQQ